MTYIYIICISIRYCLLYMLICWSIVWNDDIGYSCILNILWSSLGSPHFQVHILQVICWLYCNQPIDEYLYIGRILSNRNLDYGGLILWLWTMSFRYWGSSTLILYNVVRALCEILVILVYFYWFQVNKKYCEFVFCYFLKNVCNLTDGATNFCDDYI